MYEYRATVVSVVDGDTVKLDIDLGFNVTLHGTSVRLMGINAPETTTAEGRVAKTYLTELIPPGTSLVLKSYKDKTEKYGRILGTLLINESLGHKIAGGSINTEMLSKGYAVSYMPIS
jgi:micrococcal nuclease